MSEALRKAARELVDLFRGGPQHIVDSVVLRWNDPLVKALRAALAEPEPVEGPTPEQIRAEFEEWIKAPPYEREPMRYPQTHATWPGSYRAIDIDLAWLAWQTAYAAGRASKEPRP